MEQIILVKSIYKWNRKDDPKRRQIKFLRREIIPNKEYNIQNTAKLL